MNNDAGVLITMYPGRRRCARILLTVFLVGGLVAPVLHRFTHVHVDEHHHGEAAASFLAESTHAASTDFLVEERTSAQELVCELCARLTLTAMKLAETVSEHLIYFSPNRPIDEFFSSRSHVFSRIRAPPAMS